MSHEQNCDNFKSMQMPNQLALAVNALMELASDGLSQEWLDRVEPRQLEQQKLAIIAAREALLQIEDIARQNICRRLTMLRQNVAELEKMVEAPVPPPGPV